MKLCRPTSSLRTSSAPSSRAPPSLAVSSAAAEMQRTTAIDTRRGARSATQATIGKTMKAAALLSVTSGQITGSCSAAKASSVSRPASIQLSVEMPCSPRLVRMRRPGAMVRMPPVLPPQNSSTLSQ